MKVWTKWSCCMLSSG